MEVGQYPVEQIRKMAEQILAEQNPDVSQETRTSLTLLVEHLAQGGTIDDADETMVEGIKTALWYIDADAMLTEENGGWGDFAPEQVEARAREIVSAKTRTEAREQEYPFVQAFLEHLTNNDGSELTAEAKQGEFFVLRDLSLERDVLAMAQTIGVVGREKEVQEMNACIDALIAHLSRGEGITALEPNTPAYEGWKFVVSAMRNAQAEKPLPPPPPISDSEELLDLPPSPEGNGLGLDELFNTIGNIGNFMNKTSEKMSEAEEMRQLGNQVKALGGAIYMATQSHTPTGGAPQVACNLMNAFWEKYMEQCYEPLAETEEVQ